MEKEIIYGVFAVEIPLPEKTNKELQLKNIAETMKNLSSKEQQTQRRFIRAYKRLEDAISDCYDGNGWLITHTMDVPDNVQNGKTTTLYFPKAIIIEK